MLARYGHLEDIPDDVRDWDVTVRGAGSLAATLAAERELAMLFRHIATVDVTAPTVDSVDELAWTGPAPELEALAASIDAPGLWERAVTLAERRA